MFKVIAMRLNFSKPTRFSLVRFCGCLLGLCLTLPTMAMAQPTAPARRSHRVHRRAVSTRTRASKRATTGRTRLNARATRSSRTSAHIQRASLRRTRRHGRTHAVAARISPEQLAADHAAMLAAAQQAQAEQSTQSESAAPTSETATAIPAAESTSATDAAPEVATATYRDSAGRTTMQPAVIAIPRYIPAPMRGSHQVLVHQNIIATVEGLQRIQNDAQIQDMLAERRLVSLPASSMLLVDSRLPVNRRYCRPWAADFLSNLANAHASLFHRPFIVTSAVRTVHFQEHLERINGNAAPATGDTASPHLTGQAIDIGKKGMSMREIGWMRAYLGPLQDAGKLDVEEEFQQSCFHISIYKTYEPQSLPSGNLSARVDIPRLLPVSTEPTPHAAVPVHVASARVAPAHVSHHSSRRHRRHHVYASMMAARMR